jgi:hypothetical protein
VEEECGMAGGSGAPGSLLVEGGVGKGIYVIYFLRLSYRLSEELRNFLFSCFFLRDSG